MADRLFKGNCLMKLKGILLVWRIEGWIWRLEWECIKASMNSTIELQNYERLNVSLVEKRLTSFQEMLLVLSALLDL